MRSGVDPLFLLIGLPLPTVVAINMAFGASTRLTVALQLWREIDYARVLTLLVGAVPGMALGWLLLDHVDMAILKRGVGVVVLVAAIVLATSRPTGRRFGRAAASGVGAVAGALGIVASLNGVPPAVMYAREGRSAISTLADLAGFLVASSALSAVVVVMSEPRDTGTILIGVACWLPVALAVTAISTRFARRLPADTFRKGVIVLVAAGGLSVLFST
ncbi:sulfite exporter TauE/SafE family protein [Rhodococcus opacus]|nr:sulfite exporter TauE/SafE family protein [Rhodococcus opacus]